MENIEDRMQKALEHIHKTMENMSLKELAALAKDGAEYAMKNSAKNGGENEI